MLTSVPARYVYLRSMCRELLQGIHASRHHSTIALGPMAGKVSLFSGFSCLMSGTSMRENLDFHAYNVPSDMPCLRYKLAQFAPLSCVWKIPISCSSESLNRFIAWPYVRSGSKPNWRESLVADHGINELRDRNSVMTRLESLATLNVQYCLVLIVWTHIRCFIAKISDFIWPLHFV